MEGFSRDFLCLIGKGKADAPPPELGPGQQLREEVGEEVELGLSLGSLFASDRKGEKLPRSSSSVTAVATMPPAALPATPAVPRASESPAYAYPGGVGLRLQDSVLMPPPVEVAAPPAVPRASGSRSPSSSCSQGSGSGTLTRTSSLPVVTEASAIDESKKHKEAQNLKRQEIMKKMFERRNSGCSTSNEATGQVPEAMNAHTGKLVICDEAAVGNGENHSGGQHLAKRRRGRPPKYQATLPSQHTLSAAGKKPNPGFKGAASTEEKCSSSSVPSSSNAIRRVTAATRPLPSSPLAPRTAAATLVGSSRDQSTLSILSPAPRADGTWDEVGRRLMEEMPSVRTRDLPNGNRVHGFLYNYRQAEAMRIVCICHGRFFTPSEFVEHAGAGRVDHPMRHISVSPNQTL